MISHGVALRRVVVALAVVVALFAFSMVPSADAHEESDKESSAPTDHIAYAREYGISVDEALNRISIRERATPIIREVVTSYGDQFAGVLVEHEPDYSISIFVKGDGSRIEGLLSSSRDPVRIVDGMEHSFDELKASAGSAMRALGPKAPGSVAGIDVPSNSVILSLAPSAALSAETAQDQIRDLPSVTVVPAEGGSVDAHNRGGTYLSGSGKQCRSGFSARHVSLGFEGFLTAGHCYHNLGLSIFSTDYFHSNVLFSLLTWNIGLAGDGAMYHSSDTPSNQYFPYGNGNSTTSTRWAVTNVEFEWNIAQGDVFCAYGYQTVLQRKCRQVLYGYLQWNSATTGALVGGFAMDQYNNNWLQIPGDSGAPWSFNNTAAGIFSATAFCDGTIRCHLVSFASSLESSLGIDIRTS